MSQLKTISKKAPWYFLSSVLKGLSGFILLPIYTRYLSPDQYGTFQTLRSCAEFLPLIISFSVHNAFTRIYFDYKDKDDEGLTKLYSTIFWFLSIWGVVIYFAAVWGAQFFIKDLVNLPLWPFIPLTFLAPVFSQLSLLGDSLLRLNLDSKKFSIVSFASFFISSAFNILLLTQTELRIEACLVGYLIINLLPCIYYTYSGFKSGILKLTFDMSVLKNALNFSLPFQIAAVASWIIGYSDKIILNYFGTAVAVGNYTIAATISKLLYMFSDSVGQIQSPMSLQDFSQDLDVGKKNMANFLEKFISTLTLAFFALSLFSPEIITLCLPSSYSTSIYLVPTLAAAYVVSGVYRPYQTFLMHHKKNWVLSHGMILQTVFTIVLNLAFIPIWKDKAAAYSLLASTALFTGYLVFQSRKISAPKINFFKLLAPFVTVFTFSQILVTMPFSMSLILLKCILMLILVSYYQYQYRLASLLWKFIKERIR